MANSVAIHHRIALRSSGEGAYLAQLAAAGTIRTSTGKPGRYTFSHDALLTAVADGTFNGLTCFIDHRPQPGIANLFGQWSNVHYDETTQAVIGTLTPFRTALQQPYIDLLDQVLLSQSPPDIGISLVIYPTLSADGRTITHIDHAESADIVVSPAVESARLLARLEAGQEEEPMTDISPAPTVPASPDPALWLNALSDTVAHTMIAQAGLPAPVAERLRRQQFSSPADVTQAIDDARTELAALTETSVIQLHRPSIHVAAPLDTAEQHMNWYFGVHNSPTPPLNMRRFADFYRALTGDEDVRGVFDATRLQFAAATTTTLAGLVVNAMNKKIVEVMANMDDWRWYERIVRVEANNGSLHDMQWITFGGIGALPVVAEGAAYTELTVDDVKEADSFTKYGGYVGITREMILKSDIQLLQQVPDELAVAAVQNRSAAISAIFTQASGVGPTLEQDSVALFNTVSHGNLATTALGTDATAWRAARTECYKHTRLNSNKRLGVRPRFLLVPVDLYDVALAILGYGEGMPTTYVPEAQSRGFMDPRPIPIAVPDWTDATDWAYIVDPAVFPVIHMSYSQSPGGGSHPAPEIFSVTSETSGLVFTNDTLPIKVRDEFAAGVSGYRGIGKRNVA